MPRSGSRWPARRGGKIPKYAIGHREHGVRRRSQRQIHSSVNSTQVSVRSVSQLRCPVGAQASCALHQGRAQQDCAPTKQRRPNAVVLEERRGSATPPYTSSDFVRLELSQSVLRGRKEAVRFFRLPSRERARRSGWKRAPTCVRPPARGWRHGLPASGREGFESDFAAT